MSHSAACAVCLEQFTDEAALDKCEHHFCFFCIREWSEKTNLCPLCKTEFLEIRRLNIEAPRGTKRRNDRDPAVVPVKRVKQKATYDDDEIERLYPSDESDDEEDSDETDRLLDPHNQYDLTDGFVVGDDEEDDETDCSSSSSSEEDEAETTETDENLAPADNEVVVTRSSTHVVRVRAFSEGAEVPLTRRPRIAQRQALSRILRIIELSA